jgi:hypothetical protein
MNQETQNNNGQTNNQTRLVLTRDTDPQDLKRVTKYELELNSNDLSSIKLFLEQVTKASREGDLDWGHVELRAVVNLSRLLQNENGFKPLEEYVISEDHIGGFGINAVGFCW